MDCRVFQGQARGLLEPGIGEEELPRSSVMIGRRIRSLEGRARSAEANESKIPMPDPDILQDLDERIAIARRTYDVRGVVPATAS